MLVLPVGGTNMDHQQVFQYLQRPFCFMSKLRRSNTPTITLQFVEHLHLEIVMYQTCMSAMPGSILHAAMLDCLPRQRYLNGSRRGSTSSPSGTWSNVA